MGVLAMLEIEGDTGRIAAAMEELERLLPAPEGLVVRMTTPTPEGLVLFQLWASPAARQANADDPEHREALRASGMLDAMTGSRSRTFEDVRLTVLDA
jgi:hypothetical protein